MANEFIEKLAAQAKKDPKTIIFPETGEIKVYAAARRILDEGIAYPILVGKPDEIADFSKENGISIEGMRIVDNTDQELVQAVIKDFLALTDDFSEKGLNRRFKTPLNFCRRYGPHRKSRCPGCRHYPYDRRGYFSSPELYRNAGGR